MEKDKISCLPGTRVMIRVRDWDSHGSTISTLHGMIHSKVTSPEGYNIKLDKPHTFTGNIPLPFIDHFRCDMGTRSITLSIIFVRTFDMSVDIQPDFKLKEKVCAFFDTLSFNVVSTVLPTESKLKVSHILFYLPTGEIKTLTDLSFFGKNGTPNTDRLVYKYEHYFGFAMKTLKVNEEECLYFSSNRFAQIDLAQGLEWGGIQPHPSKPQVGETLCCCTSGQIKGNSESMDYWFIVSKQFCLLVELCCGRIKMPLEEAIEGLVIPLNPDNFPISSEVPESRFLYAGIWLIMNRKQIPEHFNLPKRKHPKTSEMEPFEVWWPREIHSGSR